MSLDVIIAQIQLRELDGCIEDAQQFKRKLSQYQRDLNNAWAGKEMNHFNQMIDNLSNQITVLSCQMEQLEQDINKAITELLEEEAAAAAFSSTP